jgi:hypothetical protein
MIIAEGLIFLLQKSCKGFLQTNPFLATNGPAATYYYPACQFPQQVVLMHFQFIATLLVISPPLVFLFFQI